jgi:DNA-binding Xre family transcriptional regulator
MPTTHPRSVRWNLAHYLERLRVTPHALMRETGLSSNTVYPIVRGEAKAVSLETLAALAAGIEALTGQRPEIADLLEIAETQESVNDSLAELLGYAKPPLTAEQLLGPDDWTAEELERAAAFEAEERAAKTQRLQREQEKAQVLLDILGTDDDLEPSSLEALQ